MKKLLATLTAVAMLATTTSAFATEIENNAGYKKEAGTYSVKSDLSAYEGQLTLLIIPEEAYLDGNIEDADILYIDQTEAGEGIFQSVGILGGTTLEAGDYYVKIGGKDLITDGIIVEKFTIVEENEGVKFIWGNVNNSANGVEITDATAIVNYTLGNAGTFGDYTVGDEVTISLN